ncbi:MAG: carbohydrate ABC transporter permease [Clostridia bacterium]|nr:carbohydrate ABC transporter permease [Clostridia bacterium]
MKAFHQLRKNKTFYNIYKIVLIALVCVVVFAFAFYALKSDEKGASAVLLAGFVIWCLIGFFEVFSQKGPSEAIVHMIVFVIFTAVALSYLYIFFWGFTAGCKTHTEIALYPMALPSEWHFRNYLEVFDKLNVAGFGFFGMLGNSLYFSILGSFIMCMMSSMLAYVTNKYRFPGSKLFMPVLLFTMMLPIYGSGGSMYKLLLKLGFVNSYSQILLSFNGMNVYYIYFHATYSNLSWNYAEAAMMDGANEFQIYFRVMFPQVINLFGALFLITWVGDWNNYTSALIYLSKLPTLAGGIYMFELDMVQHARRDILYAAYMITAVPPLLLFIFFNNVLTNNISLGGIKE